MKKYFLLTALLVSFIAPFSVFCQESKTTPITSAAKYLEYLKTKPNFPTFSPPETVIMIYSSSLMGKILDDYPHKQGTSCFSELYLIDDGRVGVFYVRGMGGPALIHKMEELIAFGVQNFISIGYAGALTKDLSVGDWVVYSKALSEDGVGHLYISHKGSFSYADPAIIEKWQSFMKIKHPDHAPFKPAVSWSFPVLFRETQEDVTRVSALGCTTVEMEVAAFFAIAQEKGVHPLALYVISDSLADGEWDPHLQDPSVKGSIKKIADLAIEFGQHEK
jgi:purine-nucleoside phosphorylase